MSAYTTTPPAALAYDAAQHAHKMNCLLRAVALNTPLPEAAAKQDLPFADVLHWCSTHPNLAPRYKAAADEAQARFEHTLRARTREALLSLLAPRFVQTQREGIHGKEGEVIGEKHKMVERLLPPMAQVVLSVAQAVVPGLVGRQGDLEGAAPAASPYNAQQAAAWKVRLQAMPLDALEALAAFTTTDAEGQSQTPMTGSSRFEQPMESDGEDESDFLNPDDVLDAQAYAAAAYSENYEGDAAYESAYADTYDAFDDTDDGPVDDFDDAL